MNAHCVAAMKMKPELPFSAICCLLLNVILLTQAFADAAAVERWRKLAEWSPIGRGAKLRVFHVYADSSPYKPPNTTWESLIWQTFATSNVPVASGAATIRRGNYIIKVDFGTPGKSFYTIIDTGSDITWIPCTPCSNCDLDGNDPFDPSGSSSYRSLTCDSAECKQLNNPSSCTQNSNSCAFGQEYGDKSSLVAILSEDTLLVGSDSISNFTFGCAHKENVAEPGLIGLGRGILSLVSQTGDLYDNAFSYCLPSLKSPKFSGSLTLGKGALSASASASLSFTPLLTNPAGRPSYYYVSLKGISVGDELLSDIPPETFGLNASDGRGGTIVDSGTVITRLVPPAYNALRDAFRKRISLTPQNESTHLFDTCYDISSSGTSTLDAPPITLHFEGGVDLELTQEKTVFSDGSVACLAFSVPPDDINSVSVIGNYQQQNMRIVYDLPNSRLGFAPDNCSA